MFTKTASHNRVIAMVYRQLILYRRHLDRMFEIFFWPTVDGILFGAIGTYAERHGAGTPVLLLAGFVMAQIVWQSHIHFAKFFMQEGWDFNVLYTMTRPIRSREVFVAVMLLTTAIVVLAGTFIATVMTLVFHLKLTSAPLSMALLIPILMLLGWSTAMIATSIVVRMGQKGDNFVWAIFGVIGPLSGSIVPVENLPGFLKYVALALPTTHAYEAGRAILFHQQFPVRELTIAGMSAVLTAMASLWLLTKSFKKFRRLGHISRYV